jgi:glutathione S-transferase
MLNPTRDTLGIPLRVINYAGWYYSFADIAFYMAQLFGERKGAPMTSETPRLLAWRDRMTKRPAVRKVAGAMAAYLHSIGRPVPDFLRCVLT